MLPDSGQPLHLAEVPADVLGCTPDTAARVRAMVCTWPRLAETSKDRLAALLALPAAKHREQPQAPQSAQSP